MSLINMCTYNFNIIFMMQIKAKRYKELPFKIFE